MIILFNTLMMMHIHRIDSFTNHLGAFCFNFCSHLIDCCRFCTIMLNGLIKCHICKSWVSQNIYVRIECHINLCEVEYQYWIWLIHSFFCKAHWSNCVYLFWNTLCMCEWVHIYMCVCLCVCVSNTSTWAGYNTNLILKQNFVILNSSYVQYHGWNKTKN